MSVFKIKFDILCVKYILVAIWEYVVNYLKLSQRTYNQFLKIIFVNFFVKYIQVYPLGLITYVDLIN